MKFGEITVADAGGAILAHSLKFSLDNSKYSFKKGRVLNSEDLDLLSHAGIETVVAARLEPGDVTEDEAATALAAAVCGPGVTQGSAFTGRCNLFAEQRGLLLIDTTALDRINSIDEGLTVATLAPYTIVEKKQMLATVKIIPFSVPSKELTRCITLANDKAHAIVRVAPFRARRTSLIQTRLPGVKENVLDKTTQVLRARLETLGSSLDRETRCTHRVSAVADALRNTLALDAELILIAGASAIVDRRDVIPAAIISAGGQIEHFGMPVDPGNLLLLGRCGEIPVLGLPGCARSPKFNGFDQVLERLAADLPVTARDIMTLGAGGLLKDFAPRPAPRAAPLTKPNKMAPARTARVQAIVLAAGLSRRMGQDNKLLLTVDGMPMIAHTAAALAASRIDEISVVTGYENEHIEQALAGYAVRFIHNPAYREGLSASLRAGLAQIAEDVDGVLICLGDMPRVDSHHIDRLLSAFDPLEGRAICVPTYRGKPGNPVLWARRFFTRMMEVKGDVGAKHLIGEHADVVCEVEMTDEGVLLDVDSPTALAMLALPNHPE